MGSGQYSALALVLACVLVFRADGSGCADFAPCNCSEIKDGVSLRCRGPEAQGRIGSAIRGLAAGGHRQLELDLQSLALEALPEETIGRTTSLRLRDVLVRRMPARTPLPALNDLVIDSSYVSEDPPWTLLRRTLALKHLKVVNVQMQEVGREFREGVPASVAYLDLRRTGTMDLRPGSMGHLAGLKYLLMVDVPLQKFPRSALPGEVRALHTFILCNTELSNLEAGFFVGMPKLQVLMLSGNHFKTLDYQLFAPVQKHLTHLLIERNPLLCDCSIIWLSKDIQERNSIKVMATCTDQKSGERKEVATLNENDYCT